jgi:hypothetical protein
VQDPPRRVILDNVETKQVPDDQASGCGDDEAGSVREERQGLDL